MLIQQMINSNPQMSEVMTYINENGGNPKTAFYKMAEEKGVDPQSIINQLKWGNTLIL